MVGLRVFSVGSTFGKTVYLFLPFLPVCCLTNVLNRPANTQNTAPTRPFCGGVGPEDPYLGSEPINQKYFQGLGLFFPVSPVCPNIPSQEGMPSLLSPPGWSLIWHQFNLSEIWKQKERFVSMRKDQVHSFTFTKHKVWFHWPVKKHQLSKLFGSVFA